jgi:DNA-damage-inducible protein J
MPESAPHTVVITVPVNERAKEDADAALAPLGFTIAEFLRRTVERIAEAEEADDASFLQQMHEIIIRTFDQPLVPNAETIAAMEAVERGEVKTFKTVEELFADLHSDADD